MKILLASDTYYPHVNGASYFTQRLAKSLHQRGHTVLVIAPSRSTRTESFTRDNVQIYGVPTLPVTLHQNFRIASPVGLKKIRKIVKEFQPDIVHIQGHFPICRRISRLAREFSIPIVATNHFMPENLIPYFPLPRPIQELLKKWAWQDFRRIFKYTDMITTPTLTAAQLLAHVGLVQKIEALSCGIDTNIFHPHHDGNYLKKKYHIPSKPVLLYVGRLDKEKHINIVLKALSLISVKNRPHFIIAGQGTERDHLQKIISGLHLESDITFTGFVSDEDLPALYCAVDCFIIAGIAELQSLVTMEAMASGLPVIAVNAVALPELVHHEKNGYLFSLEDHKQLAKYINEIMSNVLLRKKMSGASLEIIKKHSSNLIIKRYEDLYREVIKKHLPV